MTHQIPRKLALEVHPDWAGQLSNFDIQYLNTTRQDKTLFGSLLGFVFFIKVFRQLIRESSLCSSLEDICTPLPPSPKTRHSLSDSTSHLSWSQICFKSTYHFASHHHTNCKHRIKTLADMAAPQRLPLEIPDSLPQSQPLSLIENPQQPPPHFPSPLPPPRAPVPAPKQGSRVVCCRQCFQHDRFQGYEGWSAKFALGFPPFDAPLSVLDENSIPDFCAAYGGVKPERLLSALGNGFWNDYKYVFVFKILRGRQYKRDEEGRPYHEEVAQRYFAVKDPNHVYPVVEIGDGASLPALVTAEQAEETREECLVLLSQNKAFKCQRHVEFIYEVFVAEYRKPA